MREVYMEDINRWANECLDSIDLEYPLNDMQKEELFINITEAMEKVFGYPDYHSQL